jgi:acyl dehydratase
LGKAAQVVWSKSEKSATVEARNARHLVGTELFVTEWRTVDQDHLDQFHWSIDMTREATDLSASENFPDGSRNVDGFMLMSLVQSAFFSNCPIYTKSKFALNYGVDRLRFPSTVYVGDRLRLRVETADWKSHARGVLVTFGVTMDHEGRDKPAMVASFKTLFVSD